MVNGLNCGWKRVLMKPIRKKNILANHSVLVNVVNMDVDVKDMQVDSDDMFFGLGCLCGHLASYHQK